MALNKIIKFRGFDCTYHKVIGLEWDLVKGTALVRLGAFKDEDYRRESLEVPAFTPTATLSAMDFIGCPDILAKAYELLKALPEWADAEDV